MAPGKSQLGRTLFWRIAMPLGLVVLALAALEVVCRLALPLRREQPAVFWNQHYGMVQEPDFAEERKAFGKRFVYRTNSLGFRGPEVAVEKPEGVFRIVFVGGSTLQAGHLPEEEIFAFLVERMLDETLGGSPRVEVIMDSRPGRTSHQSLSLVANRLLPLDPDLVIECDAGDMWIGLHPRYEPTMFYVSAADEPSLTDLFMKRSGIVRAVQAIQDAMRGDVTRVEANLARTRAEHLATPIKDPPDEVLFRGAERPAENIRRTAMLCRDAGVAYAVMTQAWIYKPEQPREEYEMLWQTLRWSWHVSTATGRRAADSYNDGLRELARRDGLLLIDVDRAMPRDLDHFVDDCHLSPRGHQVAAQAIVDALLQAKVLPRQ